MSKHLLLFWLTCPCFCLSFRLIRHHPLHGPPFTVSRAATSSTSLAQPLQAADGKPEPPLLPYKIDMFSLQWSSLDSTTHFSKATRDVWKWKDSVLGDGRDFFIPRPKTLQALQNYLLQPIPNSDLLCLEECLVLSNCARFEIYFVTKTANNDMSRDDEINLLTQTLSRRILSQCRGFATTKQRFACSSLPLDRPANILNSNNDNLPPLDNIDDDDLSWTHLDTPKAICTHLCAVAAGLAPRPNRPDRPVVFRPFSSRDAHVLLQLKRSLPLVAGGGPLSHLLQTALVAGKAARNPQRVPALAQLRAYGTGDSSYASAPPVALMEETKLAAWRDAIQPTVQMYLESLAAQAAADQITQLRTTALALARSSTESAWIQKALHAPTLALRQGESIKQSAFLQSLQNDLEQQRQESVVVQQVSE